MGEPANLPNFKCLTKLIARGTGETYKDGETDDQFLGRLKKERGTEVHKLAAEKLSKNNPMPNELHRDLLRLYSKTESTRIVTTNFDLLFEQATQEIFDPNPEVFRAPALPLGRDFNGIVHLHGAVSHPLDMVLTDADFGRAYLSDGWAGRFLVELFRSFTVLFVGYSHDDTIMKYLARALPTSETRGRFALTEESEGDKWQILGITRIIFENLPNYKALYDGTQGLANYATRGILGWQREISEIAGKPPPLNDEEKDLIEDALLDEAKTHFFTNAATLPEWVEWLDQRKYLDSLFGTDELSEHKRELAEWLANTFAREHSDSLFLLIGRHKMQLHPALWFELGRTIGLQKAPPLDASILSRWVSILLATVPAHPYERVLPWLGERCIEAELMDSLIEIFIACAADRLKIERGFHLYDDEEDNLRPSIKVELSSISDQSGVNDLWEKGLKPNLDSIIDPLLTSVVEQLSAQFRTLCAWGESSRNYELASCLRSAIEPHEQDDFPQVIDVLIDAARVCLEFLVSNRPDAAARWCDQLIDSDVPLLRRLAIYILSKREDLTPIKKIDWFLARADLHDTPARHEIFMFLEKIYPQADSKRRKIIIEAVHAFSWPNPEEENRKERTAYYHFMWFHWLNKANKKCTFAKIALNDVWEQNPNFQQREYPDLLSWSGKVRSGAPSPWNVQNLLSRPAKNWVDDLLSFQPIDILGPNREGLVLVVEGAAKQNFEWGIELAGELVKRSEWDTDLWAVLIRAWSEELTEDKHRNVLSRLNRIELYEKHAYWVADFLYLLVRNGGVPYAPNLLREANEIAVGLWKHIDRDEPTENPSNWLNKAINRTGGKMAEFWLGSLSLWRKQQDPKPDVLNGEYLEALSGVVEEKTLAGRLGRSVLASRLPFLLAVDEEWTKENLLPLFKAHDNISEYQAVWDGFQYVTISPSVYELMKDAYLEAVPHIQGALFDGHRREVFINAYITMLAYFDDEPLEVWIPRFFDHAGEEDRNYFASQIYQCLLRMNEEVQRGWWGRWLKRYWENRLNGIPKELGAKEIESMLEWSSCLQGNMFPEAVDLAVRMPKVPLQRGLLISDINQFDLWRSYPKAVAKLLVHLGACESPSHVWHGGKALIDKLLASDIPDDLKEKLEELRASPGLG